LGEEKQYIKTLFASVSVEEIAFSAMDKPYFSGGCGLRIERLKINQVLPY
jgi:hypothetical protein